MLTQQQLQQSFQDATPPRIYTEINLLVDAANNIKSGSCDNPEIGFSFELHPDGKYFFPTSSNSANTEKSKVTHGDMFSKDDLLKKISQIILGTDAEGKKNNEKYEIHIFKNDGTEKTTELSYTAMCELFSDTEIVPNYNPYGLKSFSPPSPTTTSSTAQTKQREY